MEARTEFRNWLIQNGFVTLVVGALAALLLQSAMAENDPPLLRKAVPLETHPNMLLVHCTFYPDAPPLIEKVEILEQGRVTLSSLEGDYAVELLDSEGQPLYRHSFDLVFLQMTDPPYLLDEVERSLVLPFSEEVEQIRVVTPQGEMEVTLH